MNIWSILSVGLFGGIPLISLLVLIWCALRAPEGHEDADGFHPKQVYYGGSTGDCRTPMHIDRPANSPSL